MGDFYLAISLIAWIRLRKPDYSWNDIHKLIPVSEDRFLSFLASDDEELDYTKIIKNLDPYIYLHNFVVDQRRVALNVESFLRHFYQAQKGLPWHDSHIENQSQFFGYWSFALAAIVQKLNIDDTPFLDHMYYPRDLLGKPLLKTWEDSERGEKDRSLKHKLIEEFRIKQEEIILDQVIFASFQREYSKAFAQNKSKVFSDDFYKKVDHLRVKEVSNMGDMKNIKSVLTQMGRSLQNLEIDKGAFAELDIKAMEKAMMEDLRKKTELTDEELKIRLDAYVGHDQLDSSFEQWKQGFEHMGEMLVSLGEMYSHDDETYWNEIGSLMAKYGFSSMPNVKDIKNSVAEELKERLNKKIDISNFKISLDEFLNKKL